jgi:hypothetical protein
MFALVGRAAFVRSPGFEWLRLEVADDVALGQMLKDAGARPAVVNARDFVSLAWYRSVGDLIRGVEKNAFAVMGRYRLSVLLAVCAANPASTVAAHTARSHGVAPRSSPAGGPAYTASIAGQLALNRWLGRRALPGLFYHLGVLILLVGALRSGLLAIRRGGVLWRGTLYPTATLRAGSRLRIP